MSSLQTELAKQSKALEVSQEETQLAARIGQSLLEQNQQLDYELKATLSQVRFLRAFSNRMSTTR